MEDVHERFRETVFSHLDLSENYPGRMLRAYVRALCAGGSDAGAAHDHTAAAIWIGLYAMPAVAAVTEQHSAWWSEQFASVA